MPETMDRETMRALSAETRQQIIRMLSKRPYTASELAHSLNKHVTTVTQHLGILERSGVVRKKDRTNKWVYYTLTDKGEKFTKPYAWIMLSLILLTVGIYELFFVRYQATVLSIKETSSSAMPAAQTVQTYETNILIGLTLILLAAAVMWYAMRLKKRY